MHGRFPMGGWWGGEQDHGLGPWKFAPVWMGLGLFGNYVPGSLE
jgi:hypothetical protein